LENLPRTSQDAPEVALNRLLTGSVRSRITTAESCTGGNVAARITSVAGSSAYFYGGLVAYDNGVKTRLLGVPESVLKRHGAVSAECAQAMALGARTLFTADYAVSTTGVAGPGGGSGTKPVGLVFVSVSGPAGTDTFECRFSGDRREIVSQAINRTLGELLRAVEAGESHRVNP